MKKIPIIVPLILTACIEHNTPPLPKLDAKSFSYEEIMEQQKALQQKISQTKEQLEKF